MSEEVLQIIDQKDATAGGVSLETLRRIDAHVIHARQKHPHWFPHDDFVRSVAEMEFDEFSHAISWENRKRAEEEALDVIAVMVRFLEGDDQK